MRWYNVRETYFEALSRLNVFVLLVSLCDFEGEQTVIIVIIFHIYVILALISSPNKVAGAQVT